MPIRRQAIIWTNEHSTNMNWKNAISGRYEVNDTAHPLEILVSLVHALQDIATNGNDVLCVSFKVEFT